MYTSIAAAIKDVGTSIGSSTIFRDREESEFYAQCVRDFLFRNAYELLENKDIVELGVGTGETIVELLNYHRFTGKIRGYEIDQDSYDYADRLAAEHAVADRYMVIKDDFFEAVKSSVASGCVISNPPYIPAPDQAISIPSLWGGSDGSQVTKRIMDCGFESMILLVSSFSNPLDIVAHSAKCGYRVIDFAVRTMRFGPYSSEPRVRQRIEQLRSQGLAFVSADRYCVAGVAWVKGQGSVDLSGSLARALTSLVY